MKAAALFALVPALGLCAALTAATDGAWAGDEPVVLFPGAAADGGGRTTQAPPPPLGATAASPVVQAATAAAGEENANVGADPTEPETAARRAAIGMPVATGAPEKHTHETMADGPAGGSRLLRALAETPKAPTSLDDGAAGAGPLSGTSVFAAEGCPRALLRRLLAGAAGEADALSALGIEREILTLCRERQEILVGLFEAEAALRELSMPSAAPAPEAAVKPGVEASPPAPISQSAPAVRPAAPSPLRAALAAAEKADELEAQAPARVSPRYAWFSIIGTAAALRAGITDGAQVWFVREGDPLPGGARIAAIAGRPPSVRVTGGDASSGATPLPYRARPGADR